MGQYLANQCVLLEQTVNEKKNKHLVQLQSKRYNFNPEDINILKNNVSSSYHLVDFKSPFKTFFIQP